MLLFLPSYVSGYTCAFKFIKAASDSVFSSQWLSMQPRAWAKVALSQYLINGYQLFYLRNHVNTSARTPCVLTYYLGSCVLL